MSNPTVHYNETPDADASFVQIRSLKKSIDDITILDDISLDIALGTTCCLIGPSGAGKSTLLRCINALSTFDTGIVNVGGEHVGHRAMPNKHRKWSPREAARFRQNVGFVSQGINLFSHRTALENVMEGPKYVLGHANADAETKSLQLLDKVGLLSLKDRYPHELSGGQQQRVAIARALAMQPRLMLFDEATSALDPELANEVLRVIKDLSKSGMTMVVVTHDLKFASEVADTVAVMEHGKLIEYGNASQIFNSPKGARTKAFLAAHFGPQ